MAPAVSVVIPVFNARPFLREAVESLLREDLPSLEVVLSDDGSVDGSLDTVRDLPVTFLRSVRNRGPSAARNRGLAAAKGRFITFLDADDILVPGGLRWRLEWLEAHPEERAVGGIITRFIDESGRPLPAAGPSPPLPPRLTWDLVRREKRSIHSVCVCLYRRELLDEVGPFDETLRFAEDQDYTFRVLKHSSLPFLTRPVFHRRLHGGNLSVYWNGEDCHVPVPSSCTRT